MIDESPLGRWRNCHYGTDVIVILIGEPSLVRMTDNVIVTMVTPVFVTMIGEVSRVWRADDAIVTMVAAVIATMIGEASLMWMADDVIDIMVLTWSLLWLVNGH